MNCIIFIVAFIYAVSSEKVAILDKCTRKVEPVGCYHDSYSTRAMPIQLLNARDDESNVYAGYIVDWNDYHGFLQRFICDCAERAFKLGYKAIGIQFYGECWTGPEAHKNYAMHGKSSQCTHQNVSKPYESSYRDCQDDIVCTGVQLTNYVYRIAPTACPLYYEPVGCFKDDLVKPRPLPNYIQNERDYSISNWNGKLIDWQNWNTYSPAMLCRCAEKAKELKYKYFGLQFYGECWAGNSRVEAIRAGARGKDMCMAKDFKDCPYNSYRCIGKQKTNALYRFIEGPKKAQKGDTMSDANSPTDPHPNHPHYHGNNLVQPHGHEHGHGHAGGDAAMNDVEEKPRNTEYENEDDDVPVEVEEDDEEDDGDSNDDVDGVMDEDK